MTDQFYNTDAEECLIGALCFNGSIMHDLMAVLVPESFYEPFCRLIYTKATELHEKRAEIEIMALSEMADLAFDKDDSIRRLSVMARNTPLISDIHEMSRVYAKRIAYHFDARKLLKVADEVHRLCMSKDTDIETRVLKAQQLFLNFEYKSEKDTVINHNQMAKQCNDDIQERFNSSNDLMGLSTGYPAIDEKIGGLQKGQLIILAARPSMGKSTLALTIADTVAKAGSTVLIISMEMTASELGVKFCSQRKTINTKSLSSPKQWDKAKWDKFSQFIGECSDLEIYMDDSSTQTIASIYSKARKLKHTSNLDLLIVDHIGLIDGEGFSETERLSKISRELKRMAKDLDCPVLALSQLNRKCDDKPAGQHRPVLSDLRQSGSIEQDANVVAFLYRDVLYDKNTAQPHLTELIFRKVRGGEIGTVVLNTELQFSRFLSTDEKIDEPEPYTPKTKGGYTPPCAS